MNVHEPPDRGRGQNIKQSKIHTKNESNQDQKKPQIIKKDLNNTMDINDNHNFRYKINEAEKQLKQLEHITSSVKETIEFKKNNIKTWQVQINELKLHKNELIKSLGTGQKLPTEPTEAQLTVNTLVRIENSLNNLTVSVNSNNKDIKILNENLLETNEKIACVKQDLDNLKQGIKDPEKENPVGQSSST